MVNTNKLGEIFSVEQVSSRKKYSLRFLGRWQDKTKMDFTIEGTKPYFYILYSEANKIDFPCKQVSGYKSIYGDELIKIIVENPFEIKGWRGKNGNEGFLGYINRFSRTFEGDISYPMRYLIDREIYSGIIYDGQFITADNDITVEPRVMNLDIETAYKGGSNKDMLEPIISITFYDNYDKTIYALAYHKDNPRSSESTSFVSNIIKDLDGNKQTIDLEKIFVKDEKELLELFKFYVTDFDIDIFTGWNVNFDLRYILSRMTALNLNPEVLSPINKIDFENKLSGYNSAKSGKYGRRTITPRIRGRAVIDILKGYQRIKWKQVASFKLDSVAKEEFKVGKIEYEGWIYDFWQNNFDKFLEYNIYDVEMCEAINKKYSIVDTLLGIRKVAGSDISDVLYNSKTLDTFFLRHCKDKFVLPTKVYTDKTNSEDDVEGGFVLEPVVGLHENVVILDLKNLYPAIMLAFNMSAETVSDDGELIVGNGIRFKKETGALKEILLTLISKRDELRAMLKQPEIVANKDKYLNIYKRQYTFKTFTNSLYGATLYSGFRLYDPRVGASITYIGRTLIQSIQRYCESKGHIVIRSDTDSAFVNVHAKNKDDAIKLGKQLESDINKMFPTWFKENNVDPSYFSIKFEKLYGLMFSGEEKKLYAGRIIWDWEEGDTDHIEIKGFASVKSDRSAFSRNLQKTIFEKILLEDKEFNVMKYIFSEIDMFYTKKYPFDYIGIPKAITRDLDEYKIDNPHVRGVKWSMDNLVGFEFSPKPLLLYLKLHPNSKYQTDTICFNNVNEVPIDIEIDYEKMLMNSCYKLVEKQLQMLKLNPELVEQYIQLKVKGQTTLF